MAMADFSATNAAFEGFRLARERPAAIGIWSAFLLVFGVVTTALLIAMAGPQLAAMATAEPGADPSQMMASFGAIGPAYLLILLLSFVAYAVLYAAVFRAILRPAEGGVGFLRLGGDELRVGLALLAVIGILFVAYIVCVLAGAVVFGGAAAAAAGAGDAGGPMALVAGLIGFVVFVGLFCALIWLLVRLSLALPATFDRRSIQIASAWRLTKGRFWPLLGAYLLSFVLMIVVYLLALIVFAAIAALLGGGLAAVGGVFQPDLTSLAGYFTPLIIVYTVFTAVLSALALAITVGTTAAAYREIAGGGEGEVFA